MSWQHYFRPTTMDQALALLAEHPGARLVAGGTDLMVELRRAASPAEALIDLTLLSELRYVRLEGETIRVGALATHNDVLAAPFGRRMLPLWQASREVGAPQIRAAATVVGNLVTASPANDTIAPLVALGAELEIVGPGGARSLALADFYQGVRRTALRPGEIVRELRLPALGERQRGMFVKLGLRRAQAISVVNAAVVLTLGEGGAVAEARIALGCVAPTIIRAEAAEAALRGAALTPERCAEAGRLAAEAARPIDDVRGTAAYRRRAVAAVVQRALEQIAAGAEAAAYEDRPVLLELPGAAPAAGQGGAAPLASVSATINGERRELPGAPGHTLLDALREIAGVTGVKEGCAEGECGACTVWLNGRAVMACLTPAAQADGASVTTVEGLAQGGELHPVQRAFVAGGAVQCGFCTPGFVMAAARLLDEHPSPSAAQIQTAVSGNICRCTGYQQILAAIAEAAG